jgi:signal transduction histidine kinase
VADQETVPNAAERPPKSGSTSEQTPRDAVEPGTVRDAVGLGMDRDPARRVTVRAGLVDGLLGALLAVSLFGTAVALAGSWGGVSWVLDLFTGLIVGVFALRRHRHPARTAVAAAAVAVVSIVAARVAGLPHEPGPATVLGLAVLLAAAVRRLEPRVAAVPAGCGLAVVVAAALCSRPYGSRLDVITVVAALGWLTAVAAGLGLRLRDAQHRALLEEVRRDERLDLARELHDLAAHHLTGLVLQAQAARIVARRTMPSRDGARLADSPRTGPSADGARPADSPPTTPSLAGARPADSPATTPSPDGARPADSPADSLDNSLADIESAGSDALDAMRRVVGLLRDSADTAPMLPGPPSPAELVRNFAARPGAPVVRTSLDGTELPPAVGGTVHRILLEALTNVVRHAPLARTVTVEVRVTGDVVHVEVTDDGPAAPAARGGYGLIGMTERVTALGGEITAGPRTGGGWQVRARLPLGVRVGP